VSLIPWKEEENKEEGCQPVIKAIAPHMTRDNYVGAARLLSSFLLPSRKK
jgi:hypothetical protein